MRKKRRAALAIAVVVAAVAGIVLLYTYVGRPLIEGSRGNYRIDYYGRVVDEAGRGVQGVKITFRIIYSAGGDRPGMFGRDESFRSVTAVSNQDGNFDIKRAYGRSVWISEVHKDEVRVGLLGVDLPKEDDPAAGVLMTDRSSRVRLPDDPSKRLRYKVVPLH